MANHRPAVVERPEGFFWRCACGQAEGRATSSVGAYWDHDGHVAEVAPSLRCARCGERTHSIDYCERLP